MLFGVCGGAELAPTVRGAGYAYLEASVGARLCPEGPEADFADRQTVFCDAGLPTPVCNLFLPGDLKVVGPEADKDRQERYLDIVFVRAALAGVEVIVMI